MNARNSIIDPMKRQYRDDKVVGLAEGVKRSTISPDMMEGSLKVRYDKYDGKIPLEVEEMEAREKTETRPLVLFIVGYWTALKIFLYYLISMSSVLTITLSVGLTVYWYGIFKEDTSNKLSAGGMDWVLLGFAVVTPLSLTIGIAFRRRERALIEVAKFRSFAFQLFLAHSLWDWDVPDKIEGRAGANVDWVGHADEVLSELVAIGDELFRFLTLPSTSRSRHRVTKSGRREAARTAEVAYRLYDSFYTKRMVRLSVLSENIKRAGLPSGEVSRIRQYERFIGEAIENLRLIKSYRTPQTLRSFARLFTTILPPFFAPTYAQISVSINSLAIGITFAVVTALCLNALLEGVEILEDPFTAFVTLDGIDVREEFKVLHWQQLVNARNDIFNDVMPYRDPHRKPFYGSDRANDQGQMNTNVVIEPTAILTVEPHPDLPLGSSESRGSFKRRTRGITHKTLLSWGDANMLAELEEGVDPSDQDNCRESAYKLYNRPRADSGITSLGTPGATPRDRSTSG